MITINEIKATYLLLKELNRAKRKFPDWPDDPIHAAAVLSEESGEVVKACLDYTYAKGSMDDIIKESVQTGAMAIRMLTGKYQKYYNQGVKK
jgi:hypothetical protein